jgi:hypothetical protein
MALSMRCYFHVVNGHEMIPDDTGIEISDIDMMQAVALEAIRELRQEAGNDVEDWQGWRLNVVDPQENILLSIRLDVPL